MPRCQNWGQAIWGSDHKGQRPRMPRIGASDGFWLFRCHWCQVSKYKKIFPITCSGSWPSKGFFESFEVPKDLQRVFLFLRSMLCFQKNMTYMSPLRPPWHLTRCLGTLLRFAECFLVCANVGLAPKKTSIDQEKPFCSVFQHNMYSFGGGVSQVLPMFESQPCRYRPTSQSSQSLRSQLFTPPSFTSQWGKKHWSRLESFGCGSKPKLPFSGSLLWFCSF